jgi:DNA primase
LFERERDLEPLDTPERKAGLKNRLKAAAKSILDKELAQAYRDELLARGEALYAKPAPEARAAFTPRPRAKGKWQDRDNVRLPSTPEGQAAAQELARSLNPMAAAVAQGALNHPAWMDDHLEALESYGFGDQTLNELASEIIRLRLSADTLDSEPLLRHLAERGYGLQLNEVAKAARKSNAPFLAPDQPPAAARNQWSQAFEVLTRMSALESALRTAKADADRGLDAQAFSRLKTERDAIRRAIKSGTFWSEPGWAESVSLG